MKLEDYKYKELVLTFSVSPKAKTSKDILKSIECCWNLAVKKFLGSRGFFTGDFKLVLVSGRLHSATIFFYCSSDRVAFEMHNIAKYFGYKTIRANVL